VLGAQLAPSKHANIESAPPVGSPRQTVPAASENAAIDPRRPRIALAEQESRSRGAAVLLRNDQGSLLTVRRDYRNDSGAGVSTEDSSDLLLANLRVP
jgi:hypothetical protein